MEAGVGEEGASADGAVCSGTALEPWTGRSTPFSQSRKACWFFSKSGLTVISSLLLGALGTVGLPSSFMKRFQSQYVPGSQCMFLVPDALVGGTPSWPMMCWRSSGMSYLAAR